jgi:hypothetical protein
VRSFLVEDLDELIEALLLLKEIRGGWFGSFFFQRTKPQSRDNLSPSHSCEEMSQFFVWTGFWQAEVASAQAEGIRKLGAEVATFLP